MRVVPYERYGSPDVLQFRDIATPVPKHHEVLIKTHATTVTTGDWRARSLEMPAGFGLMGRLVFGVSRPRQPILGSELAGEVESVGQRVTRFKAGDQVFAFTGARLGCHAEYKCMPEDGAVALKPTTLSYEEAAAMSFGGTTMLDFSDGESCSGATRYSLTGRRAGSAPRPCSSLGILAPTSPVYAVQETWSLR